MWFSFPELNNFLFHWVFSAQRMEGYVPLHFWCFEVVGEANIEIEGFITKLDRRFLMGWVSRMWCGAFLFVINVRPLYSLDAQIWDSQCHLPCSSSTLDGHGRGTPKSPGYLDFSIKDIDGSLPLYSCKSLPLTKFRNVWLLCESDVGHAINVACPTEWE